MSEKRAKISLGASEADLSLGQYVPCTEQGIYRQKELRRVAKVHG